MRVLPLASRCAFEMYGLKNSNSDWSAYCQTIVFVRGSTSMTRENVPGWSRRCVPLSKISRLPLSSGRGSCCWASGGLPSCHTIFPVARATIRTVEMLQAHHDVAAGCFGNGVAVRPLRAAVLEGHRVGRRVEMLPASPFPHEPAADGHLHEVVGVYRSVRLGAGQPTLNPACEL